MKRFLLFLLILPSTLLAVPEAHAQYRRVPSSFYGGGVGVFIGTGGYGGGYLGGPGFGFYPSYYNGFYGNGFSAYGPPVPTYATIPGVFGGSDQRNYGTPPGILGQGSYGYGGFGYGGYGHGGPGVGFGLGRYGYRSPSPRPIPNFDYVASDELNLLPVPEERLVSRPLTIEVRCPENAVVMIDGKATQQAGPTRTFVTPSLSTQESVTFEVRVQWTDNGKPITKLQAATGRGGDRVVVDFVASRSP